MTPIKSVYGSILDGQEGKEVAGDWGGGEVPRCGLISGLVDHSSQTSDRQ